MASESLMEKQHVGSSEGSRLRGQEKRKNKTHRKVAYFCASFGLMFAVWESVRAVNLVNPKLLPSILQVLESGARMWSEGSLQAHMSASFKRVLLGFSQGIAMAIVFGFIIGWFRAARMLLDPVINFLRALPPIALIPLMIIFFGIGEMSKVVVLTYASFFPALVVIYQALVGLDPLYIRAAKALGANNFEIFKKVILPQLVPHIITACRVSLGVCWATLVAAELIAAQKGIGAMMVDAQNFFQMPPLVLGIILIGAISLAMDAFVRRVEQKVTAWQEKLS
mgnify:CR=1 FL=1